MDTTRTRERTRVRRLMPADDDAVVRLDARVTGRRREAYFKALLKEAHEESGIRMALAAERDGLFVGFLLARVYYGEFGLVEPEAVLDTLGVDPGFARQGVASALLEQLRMNVSALGIRRIRTEVDWQDADLLAFFHRSGFLPAARLCLELALDPERSGRRREDEQAPDEDEGGPP